MGQDRKSLIVLGCIVVVAFFLAFAVFPPHPHCTPHDGTVSCTMQWGDE
jgi:hypothetical protein